MAAGETMLGIKKKVPKAYMGLRNSNLADIRNGQLSCLSRTALIDGHSNRITGSDVSADRKHLATVSLDLSLKVSLTSRLCQSL